MPEIVCDSRRVLGVIGACCVSWLGMEVFRAWPGERGEVGLREDIFRD